MSNRLRNPLEYHPFFIRLTNWEYWPMSITVIPVVFFYFWQSLRARSLAFFTAINPALYMGGFYGTPKSEINKLIPDKFLPWSLLILEKDKDSELVISALKQAGIPFPVILKPNVGERGLNVHKVASESALETLLHTTSGDVLIQEYVNYPLEATVLCYSIPGSGKSDITSVCTKEFLRVTGDGASTLEELIRKTPRALLQLDRLSKRFKLDWIPDSGQEVALEPIGNHNRGTKFINANHLIDDDLREVFVPLLQNMEGVNFGRFDLRAQSMKDLKQGRHFKVLEFNGVNAEPVHIYDPDYPVWKAYRDLWRQWQLLGRIALEQRKLGVDYCPTSEGWRAFRNYLSYKKRATRNL
jgi:hypothetical protein